MAVVVDQNIPAGLADGYAATLGSSEWLPDNFRVYKRHPFRIPSLQGCRTIRPPIPRGSQVTDPMCINRYVFGQCVKCFQKQPATDGEEPDGIGPYARDWWFTEAIGKLPWYFNYFMQQTMDTWLAGTIPNWCKLVGAGDAYTYNRGSHLNFGGYNRMRIGQIPEVGSYFQGWIYRLEPMETLWLYKFADFDPIGPPPDVWDFDVFEMPTPWNEGGITWDNQPAAGKYITSFSVIPGIPHWNIIEVGPVLSITIKPKAFNMGGHFRTKEAAETAQWPAWTA